MTTYHAQPTAPGGRRRRTGIGGAARMGLILFTALLALGVVGAGVAVAAFAALSRGLPPATSLEQIELPEMSVVWDRAHETELARFGEFNRTVVAFDEIPPVLIDATTAIEDASFWDNAGFDPVGIAAAGPDAIRGRPRGASTITQQLVRQRLLTSNGEAQTEVTATRKVKEIIQSIRVTQAFPGVDGKERIMAAYLNQNYYGNESYGVAAAAEGYFGKELADLTLAEAAIIAALPQAPSAYDLVRNAVEECLEPGDEEDTCKTVQLVVPEDTRIVQRRNLVLQQMANGRTPLTDDEFTEADFEAAMEEKVVLAPQRTTAWKASHFVWQVRRELTARLCGEEAETCRILERGGLDITTTLDWRLQRIAEKWVKASVIVPHAKSPAATAEAIGVPLEPWMRNLRNKDLRNGALVAMDYQTGELVAYVGSANANATRATKKFQPRYDVIGDGWRQPGSAFKPIVYGTGIHDRTITAASMFMDVVTDFGGGYTPTNADNLERGPLRVRDALRFSLNIPAVKAVAVIGNDRVQEHAEAMGVTFRDGEVDAGLSFALGVEEVRPIDLIRGYGVLADGGRLADQTTIISVDDAVGDPVLTTDDRDEPQQVMDPAAAYVLTDILAGNTDPRVNPFWGAFRIVEGDRRRPATLKTGTNNDARDLNAYGYIGAPSGAERDNGEFALAVGVWNGNSDNSVVSTPERPVFSIDVSTYVWQGFLQEATDGWNVNGFRQPESGLQTAAVDPWTGLAAQPGDRSVEELFLEGTAPSGSVERQDRCGDGVLQVAGFERNYPDWLAADEAWLARAERGPGVRGGPENTRTSYFYNNGFNPYGRSWGPLLGGGEGCATPSPSPSASLDPCDPLFSPDPSASVDPLASPLCPSASAPPSESPSAEPSPEPSAEPTAEPTAAPTEPPATPTPTPTPPPTAPPTAAPTAPPTAPPSAEPPAASP
jgi:membrane peptidoglycan carboxypeptidase